MMFPSAVQGHMPYVDKYKQQQIKKVVEKARSRHHSGPEKSSAEQIAKQKSIHSMPILWQSVYAGQKPRFISMPNSLNTHNKHLHAVHHSRQDATTSSKQRSKTTNGNSFLSSIKKLFSSRKNEPNVRDNSSGAIIESNSARPYSTPSKKPADTDYNANQSPKRQRVRTISNISSVMETIEEVNEIMASRDKLHDSSSSSSSDSRECDSIASAPELGAGSLYYGSFGNLSNTSSVSSHQGSNEILCAA